LSRKAILLHWLSFVVKGSNDQPDSEEDYQEKHAYDDIENMNPSIALKVFIYCMLSVVAIQTRYEYLKKRHVEYPY